MGEGPGQPIRHQLTTYDGFDRPVIQQRESLSGQPASDEIIQTEYYPGGQPHFVTNALEGQTEYTLDGMNRVIATSATVAYGGEDPVTTVTEYDPNGNKSSETDRRGIKRVHDYDALNRVFRTTVQSGPGEGPTGVVATYGYDLVGNKTSETDVNGLETGYDYDGLYRVETKWLPATMPEGFTLTGRLREDYTYDKVGNLLTSKDANGHVTTRAYDALNRVTKVARDPIELNPAGLNLITTSRYCNDPASTPPGGGVNKCEEHDEKRGLRTLWQYDELGRETVKTVKLEGEDGDPATGVVQYRTGTEYLDGAHALLVTEYPGAVADPPSPSDPRTVTKIKLDGQDREIERSVDFDGLNLKTTTTYDGAGNKKSVTDARKNATGYGGATTWTYDQLGRLREVKDAKGKSSKYTYWGDGLKKTEEDRRGVVKEHTYDNLGRPRVSRLVTTQYSGVGWSHEVEYVDVAQPQRRKTDAKGNVTVLHLDGLGRVTKQCHDEDNYVSCVETTWDGVNKRKVKDRRGNEMRYDYDALDRLRTITDPAPFQAQTVVTTYDDANNRVTEKDRRGTFKVTQTDPLGRVASVTRDGVLLERNTYDAFGAKVLAVDGEGKQTKFIYDPAKRLSQRIDGFGTTDAAPTTFVYDANGNKTAEIDPRTAPEPSARLDYDELNRLTDEWDGEDHQTAYGYDEEGNRTSKTEPKGLAYRTDYTYDELGKLLRVTQPAVAAGTPETRYTYDASRNLEFQYDAKNQVTERRYDKLNRLERLIQDPAGANLETVYGYDRNGNVTTLTDPNEQAVTTQYDELNRPTLKTYGLAAGAPDTAWRRTSAIGYGYDENGNLTTIGETVVDVGVPAATLSTVRGYDRQDRLLSEQTTTPEGQSATVVYTYYANGTRKTVKDNDDLVTLYEYDGQNRLKTAKTNAGTPQEQATDYQYWPDDLLKEVTYPSGLEASYAYDAADRLSSLTNTKAATVVSSYGYSYDDNGNRTQQIETNGGLTEPTDYTYDNLDRLATVTYPIDATHPTRRTITYGYDKVGNRLSEIERDGNQVVASDKTAAFDALNRLVSVTDPVQPANDATFGWDDNGNLLTKTTGGTTTTYVYDTRDKLVETREGAPVTARFQYDFDGRRTKKIGDDGLVQYVYDQTAVLNELNSTGATTAKYEWGSDRLISLTRTNEPRRYYSFDGLGSVTNLTDDAGTSVAAYHLDAWGNYRFPAELNNSHNRFGFTGYLWDAETDLYYAKARYFDPQFGRFLTQDSYLGQYDDPPSLHRYFYANDNPLRYVDPTGHFNMVGDYASTGWGKALNFGANFYVEAYKGSLELMANVTTLGGYGGAMRAHAEGQDAVAGSAAGVFNTVTFGAAEGAVAAYAENRSVVGGAALGFANTFVPIEETKTLLDPKANGWEKAQAVATGTTKLALSLAGVKVAVARGKVASGTGTVVEGSSQASLYEPVANITPEAAALGEFAAGAPEGAFGVGGGAALPAAAVGASAGASGSTPPAPAKPLAYSTAYQAQLKPSSYPGVSRARHFQEANEALLKDMESNPEFANTMSDLGVDLQRTPTGLAPRQPPTDFVWHHGQGEGVMQLVPKAQHNPGSAWWDLLHPSGKGGYAIWGRE